MENDVNDRRGRKGERNDQNTTIDISNFLKYGKVATQFSLPVLFYIGGQVLAALKDVDTKHTAYFLLFGMFLTVVWLIRDRLHDNADSELYAELHENLEPKDRDAQTEIHVGLHSIGLVDCGTDVDTETLLIAHVVNSRCAVALAPSVFQNHHAKELLDSKPERYIERKVRQVMKEFSGKNEGYRLLTQGLLDQVPFEEAVRAFVIRWVRDCICPAIKHSCEEKIRYYRGVLRRRSISRKTRASVNGWLAKNEQYIGEIDDLINTSGIQSKHLLSPVNASGVHVLIGTKPQDELSTVSFSTMASINTASENTASGKRTKEKGEHHGNQSKSDYHRKSSGVAKPSTGGEETSQPEN